MFRHGRANTEDYCHLHAAPARVEGLKAPESEHGTGISKQTARIVSGGAFGTEYDAYCARTCRLVPEVF
jgi:hypothetical protein